MEFSLDSLLILKVHNESPKYDNQYICSTVLFLTSSLYQVCKTKSCKESKFIQFNTIRWATVFLQFVNGLRAGLLSSAGRMRPDGRRFPTPGVKADHLR